jgi:endonuclease-8
MPEGDTLRRLADKISTRFAGHTVARSKTRDPRIATVDLAGRVLVDADAYGKHLFVRFDDGRSLHAHLRLHGSFEVGRPSRGPEWKRRVELWFDDGRLTGVDVPVLEVIETVDEHLVTDPLGPDLCAPSGPPDIDEIAARMSADGDSPLAGALLDQRNVAGFGNVYANDVPFITGLDPRRSTGSIEGLAGLVAIGTALIRVNAERGPQNTTGRKLATDDRWVHGAGRRLCPVCGVRLEYLDAEASPWQRSITWCPRCQPDTATCAEVDLERAHRLIALHPAVRQPYFPPRPGADS